jgi:AAA domain
MSELNVIPAFASAEPVPPEPETGRGMLTASGVALYRRSGLQTPVSSLAWLWEGYLSPGSVTLLTGQWKAGKTTLLANLLGRLGSGGTLAGQPVRAGTAVVLSEEASGPWLRRMEQYGIGDAVTFAFDFHVRRSDRMSWERLMEDLLSLYYQRPMDLLVLDTIGSMLPPGAEGNAGVMTDLLRPLRELSWLGVSVLLAHHPRKGLAGYGQKARGTGALPAAADVLVEFDWAGPRVAENRRRVMRAWSRHAGTPPRLLLELNPEGTDYAVLPDPESAVPDGDPTRVLTELLREPEGRTLREVLAAWPAGEAMPSERTLLRRLAALVDSGWLARTGRGDRFDPYRYRVA